MMNINLSKNYKTKNNFRRPFKFSFSMRFQFQKFTHQKIHIAKKKKSKRILCITKSWHTKAARVRSVSIHILLWNGIMRTCGIMDDKHCMCMHKIPHTRLSTKVVFVGVKYT